VVGLSEFHNILSSDNKTDVVLGYIALVSLGAISIDVGENSVVGTLCCELKSLESDNRTTLVLSNTRELDRELFYKLVYLI